ncbi:hypothetical protein ACFWP2_09975 [Kitasatospora sp. NPDC058444]|uniref:hypothetical protein n=1 Tax=Kitasatospora sp. NPDC058444 TaxID=3346504 RepID=UPI0036549785
MPWAPISSFGYQPIGEGTFTTMVEKYAKAGLRRAGKDNLGRAQQALDALVVPPPTGATE